MTVTNAARSAGDSSRVSSAAPSQRRNRSHHGTVLAFSAPTSLTPFFPCAALNSAVAPTTCPLFHLSPYGTVPHSTTATTTRNFHHPSLRHSAAAAPSPTSEQNGNTSPNADLPSLKKPRRQEAPPPTLGATNTNTEENDLDEEATKVKSHDNDEVDVGAVDDEASDSAAEEDDLQLEDMISNPAPKRQQYKSKPVVSGRVVADTKEKVRSISEIVDDIERRLSKEVNLQRTFPNQLTAPVASSPVSSAVVQDDGSTTLATTSSPVTSPPGDDASPNTGSDDSAADGDETVDQVRPLLSLSERMRLEGHEAEIKGEHYLASQIYFRSIKLDAQNGKAWQNLAKTEGRRKRSLKATAAILKKALRYNPYNAYIWQSLGFVLFRMRKYDEARTHFQTGISRNSKHAPLYSTWAHLEYALKNITKARELYDKGSKIEDGGSRVYHNWGQMELKLGNEKKALYLFELGLRLDPFNSFIWETLGTFAWKRKKDYRKARQCYQNALKATNVNVVVFDSWAKLEASLDNFDEARSIFQKGIDFDSRDSRMLTSFAQFEFRNDRTEEAKKLIERAVLLAPTDHVLWTQYAKIEAALGHYPRARAMFNRACEINAKDWRSWDAWSMMEHELGNFQQAEKLVHESFRVRFNAKGDFSVLANSIHDNKDKSDQS